MPKLYDHDVIEAMAREGVGPAEIARTVGCSYSAVREACRSRGIGPLPARDHDWDKVVRLTLEGRSAREIAELVGCSQRQVVRIRKAMGVGKPAVVPMSDEELAMAESMLDDGCSIGEVARTLGRPRGGGLHKKYKGRGWSSKDGATARKMFAEVRAARLT
jgi:hypothetical protein